MIVALHSLQKALPVNDIPYWNEISFQYKEGLEALSSANDDDKREIVARLVRLIQANEKFFLCFSEELDAIQELRNNLSTGLLDFPSRVLDTDYDSQTIMLALLPNIEASDTARIVSLMPGGIGGAKSIKLKNIKYIDLPSTLETLAGMLLIAGDGKYNSNPYMLCAGILLIIQSVLKLSFQKIDVQEASVLWGFYKAKNKANIATESMIQKMTNRERINYKFSVLSDSEVTHSLYLLSYYRCVERLPGASKQWKLIEKVSISV